MRYLFGRFKLAILSCLSRENTKKDKDYSNTNRIDRYWYLPSSKYPKYPELPSSYHKSVYPICSEDSRHISNHFGYSNSFDSIARSVQFFIEEERKHYRRLNTYVFRELSSISRDRLISFEENSIFPTYIIPTFSYYKDAVLHMKKDETGLDLLVNGLIQAIKKFNKESRIATNEIVSLISDNIKEAGFSYTNVNHKQDISNTNQQVRRYLKHNIYLYDDKKPIGPTEFIASIPEELLPGRMRDIAYALIKNHEIIEKVETMKAFDEQILAKLNIINSKAQPISTTINDQDYNTRTDCCPTFWTLARRFI